MRLSTWLRGWLSQPPIVPWLRRCCPPPASRAPRVGAPLSRCARAIPPIINGDPKYPLRIVTQSSPRSHTTVTRNRHDWRMPFRARILAVDDEPELTDL